MKFSKTFLTFIPSFVFSQSETASLSDTELVSKAVDILNKVKATDRTGNVQFDGLSEMQSRLQMAWLLEVDAQSNGGQVTLPTQIREGLESFVDSLTPKDISNNNSTSSVQNRVNHAHCPNGNCQVNFALQPIWGYGCWCNFDSDLMEGRGRPQNKYDEICRDMQLCLRCARFDGKNEGYECDPITQGYGMGGGPDFTSKCSAGNPDNECAAHTCTCEQQLLSELVSLAFQPAPVTVTYEAEYLHLNGFDYETNCPPPQQPIYDMSCCGLYPRRFPYGVGNPYKDCCDDDQIYNPLSEECCDDGSVALTGTCA